MAEIEAELLLTGKWKNIEDLEESLNLQEINAIISALREKEHREHKFMAALKGIDLDENKNNDAEDAFERSKRRAEAVLRGESLDDVNRRADAEMFGLEFEVEE